MKKILFFLLFSFAGYSQTFKSEDFSLDLKKDSIVLSGTLTVPDNLKKPTLAILISGSGQTDRDETILGHKLFKELEEHLSSNGNVVLRYDDSGGFKSSGKNLAKSTSYELSEDAEAIFNSLKKDKRFKKSKIGFIGHSEGGFIVPMIAARNPKVDFIVTMAGTAVGRKQLLLKQNKEIMLLQGIKNQVVGDYLTEFFEPAIDSIIQNKSDTKEMVTKLAENYRKDKGSDSIIPAMFKSEQFAERFIAQIGGTWGSYFLKTDPKLFWTSVKCPVLAINGDKDLQVNLEQNLHRIESYLKIGKNKHFIIKELSSHNRLFQVAKMGSVMEYGQLKEGI